MTTEGKRGKNATTDQAARRSADHNNCCDIDIHIESPSAVNIYNCDAPSGGSRPPCDCPPCPPPRGTCIPVVAGAKHKLSREQKLSRLAEGMPVPSSIAASVMHMMRRYLLGATPGNPLEVSAFATFGKISRDLLHCTITAFDAAPPQQRNLLFTQSLLTDPSQPLDESALTTALGEEVLQRIGVQVFGDPNGMDQERPGSMRIAPPEGEFFPTQVRICKINGLRTRSFIPALSPDDYRPDEIQHDCTIKIVDGQPQVDCQVRTTDCPGNSLDGVVCGRVLALAFGDGVLLEGVNYFSVNAKVRFGDPQTSNPVRDVDTHVWGDVTTPVTEVVNGQTKLINDCRVDDRLTFSVPDDLAPGTYTINVVVPNVTGIPGYGPELLSNTEYLTIVPAPTTRFQIVTEKIYARQETSPAWWGSDEVGLHTLAAAFDTNFQLIDLPDLGPPYDATKRTYRQEQRFTDIQDVDFDSGTSKDITRPVFAPDKPWLGMLLVVLGDEIDSQHAYNQEVTSTWDNFMHLLEVELPYIRDALAGVAGVLKATKNFSWASAIFVAVGLALLGGIDALIAWWAPADPIIRDSIALSVNDLATLTSANTPAPGPTTFTSTNGIAVDVNKTIPPVRRPFEYDETRQYENPACQAAA